jgi:hypothetical protein
MPFCGLRINSIMLGNLINRLINSVQLIFLRVEFRDGGLRRSGRLPVSDLQANDFMEAVFHIRNTTANVMNTQSWPTDKDVL